MRFLLIVCLVALVPSVALAQADKVPANMSPSALQARLAAKNERLKAHEAQIRASRQNAENLPRLTPPARR